MRIMTIGMSPYNYTSTGRLHASILKHLSTRYPTFSLVWGHNCSLFVPNEKNTYFYEADNFKIPLIPFKRGANEAVPIYEAINSLKPDMIITIGEFVDFGFMKAVRTFTSRSIKWINVITNSQFPIDEDILELTDCMDAILCTNRSTAMSINLFQPQKTVFVGSDMKFCSSEKHGFRIMAIGKSVQADNLATLMEVSAKIRTQIPELELYIHTNNYDQGECDLNIIKARFDPCNEFIKFPSKYVSMFDGVSNDDLALELSKSNIFVSIPLVSGTSMSVFDALASGCFPIMSRCGCNNDVAAALEEHLGGKYKENDFLVRSIPLLTIGESYIHICDPDSLTEKILWAYKNKENIEGDRKDFSVFSEQHSRSIFMDALVKTIEETKNAKEFLCLEPVRRNNVSDYNFELSNNCQPVQ